MKCIIGNKDRTSFFKSPGEGIVSNKNEAHIYSEEKAIATLAYFPQTENISEFEIIYLEEEKEGVEKGFSSSKVFNGFSTTFRQWRATDTHCSFLHGYAISFEVSFAGELDERNWVWDFGGMKRAKTKIDGVSPKVWMDQMFDHTTIIAEDDPELRSFIELDKKNLIQLRIIPATGAEQFAKFIFEKLNDFVLVETDGRVRVTKVKFMENNKNSASYGE